MKREEIKQIFEGATDEQLDRIMSINGADVERAKGKLTAVEAELKEKKDAFDALSAELDKVKSESATADDFKSKFEALQNEIREKEAQAEANRIAKEKADSIGNRFASVIGEKKFSHPAIEADYKRKFSEALESQDFEGKSDAEIFDALTKDDVSAFKGVTVTDLSGAKPFDNGKKYESKEQILAIKDKLERQTAIAENLDLFN